MDALPQSAKPENERRVPKWATDPFGNFIDDQERLGQVLDLYKRGTSMTTAMPNALKALALAGQDTPPKRVTQIEKVAALAEQELKHDFPLLNAMAAVHLWTCLESMIKNYLGVWISNHPSAYQAKPLQLLKIPVGEYEQLKPEQRAHYLADLLDRELNSALKSGVTRFESLLAPFGLGGELEDGLRKTLFELHQIRNVLVHRRGIADRRFVDACPHLGYLIGQRVNVGSDQLHKYASVAMQYITELIYRVSAIFGNDIRNSPEPSPKERDLKAIGSDQNNAMTADLKVADDQAAGP